jgi:nucleoside-diphosphate-sugar epimerase
MQRGTRSDDLRPIGPGNRQQRLPSPSRSRLVATYHLRHVEQRYGDIPPEHERNGHRMRVLVTGHDGYIGRVLVRLFQRAGHEVVGLDSFLFEGCTLGSEPPEVPAFRVDLRDLDPSSLEGFEAVVHLAAISNDPLGDLDPGLTYQVNHEASVDLARAAKEAGVIRFLFSSSCSLYGASGGDAMLSEEAAFNPVTAYGESKVLVERDVAPLADDRFSPTFLRNATGYGMSPRLRTDIVVNDLVGHALATGEILIKSDGTPWRPLVHVEDIARTFLAVLEAPRETVHNEAFNVGRNEENYRISEVAEMVADTVPGSGVTFAEGASPDLRTYRVDFSKVARSIPTLRLRWTVRGGVEQLVRAYRENHLTAEEFLGPRYTRLARINERLEEGSLDASLRPTVGATT